MSPLHHIVSDLFQLVVLVIVLFGIYKLFNHPQMKKQINEYRVNPKYKFKSAKELQAMQQLGISYWRKSQAYKKLYCVGSPLLKRAHLNR